MSVQTRRTIALWIALAPLLAANFDASAIAQQSFPVRPIRLVVPFAPGGGTDIIARALARGLEVELGQSAIVDNKPGASTIVGTEAVARSSPDGYSLLVATLAHAVNPSLHAKLPFNTDTAFAPVTLIASSHNVLVVKADSSFKSVADIIAAAKATPNKLTYASQGQGTSAHLAGELFKNLAKVDITHVPYRGAAPALNDLLGGHVDMMFATNAAVASFVAGGQLRALAITAPAGQSKMPNVPAVADAGLPGYVVDSWYALFAPAGTPLDVVEKLNAAIKKAAQTPEFAKLALSEGLIVKAGSPQELADYVKADEIRWRKIVIENKITAE